jgi:uncharacterized protein (DUF427 family)
MRLLRRPGPHDVERVPGKESVWDYPRPPRLEPVDRRLHIVFGGVTVADTTAGYRVLETSHPPNYYLPPDAFVDGTLVRTGRSSYCEWKGEAHYVDVVAGGRTARQAAWGYDHPTPDFAAIAGYVAVYAGPMDACTVEDELVVPQPGGYYGGWITDDVTGPFKGGPGSDGW